MKTVKRISGLLRVIGVVLVLVSIALWLYSLANTGGSWNTLKTALNNAGVQTGFLDRIRFDSRYFGALSDAAGHKDLEPSAQAARLEKYFEGWSNQAEKALAASDAEALEAAYRWFEEEFDTAAFSERYAQMEDSAEVQELRTIFEYVDNLGAAPKKGKLAALKAASQEPFFQSYYAEFAARNGENAGSWYEFMRTVRALMKQDTDGGATLRSAQSWMADSFTEERYFALLPQIQAEEKAQSTESFTDDLAALCEQKAAGGQADFRALLRRTRAAIQAKYPNEDLGSELAFVRAVQKLLDDASFDGTYTAIAGQLRTEAKAEQEASWAAGIRTYTEGLVKEANERASIGVVALFWAIVSNCLLLLAIGIALILAAKALHTVMSRRAVRLRKSAGIQENDDVLLRVSHLKQYFRSGNYINKAVDDVSFFVRKGEVFGLVGESGCGKTTTGRTIINLYDPTEGDVYFEGLRISSTQNGLPVLKRQLRAELKENIAKLKEECREQVKQHPENAASLQQEVKEKISALRTQLAQRLSKAEDAALESSLEKEKCVQMYREKRKAELTAAYEADIQTLSGPAAEERKRQYETEMQVAARDNIMTRMQMIFQDPIASINPRMTVREIIAEGLVIRGVKDKQYIDKKVYEMLELVGLVPEHADRYPHEFSGGQRQRIGIARAIVMEPDLIIADEPISALDVSIQAQVINLLNDLRSRMGLTIMFIAHNLSVVKYFSDRIAVMYYGKIVEMTTSDELFAHPLHPYTKSLLSAIPYPDPHYEKARKRIEYNPAKAHDYSKDKPTLREIVPGHFIYCNDAEYAQYQKELGL